MSKQRKTSDAPQLSVDKRIADLSGRVFRRLDIWARMALVVTMTLAAAAWVLGLVAIRGLRAFPAVAFFFILVLIPAIAAWVIGRRARAVHQGLDGLTSDLATAINDPEIRHLFDGFLGHGDDRDDGRPGLARLARGAMGIRKVASARRDTLIHLWGAVRAMLTSPVLLAMITIGIIALALLSLLFGLIILF